MKKRLISLYSGLFSSVTTLSLFSFSQETLAGELGTKIGHFMNILEQRFSKSSQSSADVLELQILAPSLLNHILPSEGQGICILISLKSDPYAHASSITAVAITSEDGFAWFGKRKVLTFERVSLGSPKPGITESEHVL